MLHMEMEAYAQGYRYMVWRQCRRRCARSDGYRTPPDFMPTVSPPLLSQEKLERRGAFYKGYGVVYLPVDIKGLTDKLHLLEEFLAGNTTVLNELVHMLDALLRLKQLTCREYMDINNLLASTLLYIHTFCS